MSDLLRYVGGTTGAVTIGAVTATAAAWYMMGRDGPPPVFMIDRNCQTREVPGIPGARMSALCTDGKLIHYPPMFPKVRTLYDVFSNGKEVSSDGDCLGWREGTSGYQWIPYSTVLDRAHAVGCGLVEVGMKPENSTHIGIYSQNKVDYVVTEIACYSQSMVIVPLYDTLGPEACTYIVNNAEIELVVCDTADRMSKLLDTKDNCPNLKYIVCMSDISQEDLSRAKDKGLTVIRFDELEERGRASLKQPNLCTSDDLACICYTSGTTGVPKGAMLTHGNIVACVAGSVMTLEYLDVGVGDTIISYLPLAHMFERTVQFVMYLLGARVGFSRGDVRLLMEDIAELKPTVFPTVPRLLNRVYDKVMATVNSSRIKRFLFDLAMNSKMKDVRKGIFRRDTIWDKLVFAKVQQTLGGKVKFIVTGSAPLSSRVLDFARCATGAVVSEGYGQTENVATATLQVQGEGEAGHVGPPISSIMIKLVDVPEMEYRAENGQGEICLGGPTVFKGYLKQPEKTAEAIDKDGWLHTGDIGMWLPNGVLRIIDRKKNIFKLAQGEYIAPEKIENVYIRSPAVAQVFVHGNSLKACLVAIVVPDPETIKKWVQSKLGKSGSVPELCKDKAVKDALIAELTSVGKSAGLHSFEQVKDIHVHPDLFSVENGLLTPTFKTKRQEVSKIFSQQLDDMYRHLS